MKKFFSDYGINKESLLLCSQLSFIEPSCIQQKVIDMILTSKDDKTIVIKSEAGTGKTLAYLLLLLSNMDLKIKKLQGIILLPTRELALQTKDYIDKFNQNTEGYYIKYKLLIGGKANIPGNIIQQKYTEADDSQVMIGTLGKIGSTIIKKSKLYPSNCFLNIKNLIIDEADKFQSQNQNKLFESFIRLITQRMTNIHTTNAFNQIILCSASFNSTDLQSYKKIILTNNQEFLYISQSDKTITNNLFFNNSNFLTQNTITDKIYEYYFIIHPEKHLTYYEQKYESLVYILNRLQSCYSQCIIFYNSKSQGEELAMDLRSNEFSTSFIHGDLSQDQRQLIYEKIKSQTVKIIVSTDLLSRGIDLTSVNLVINFDIPFNPVDYYHRVGRTGRFFTWGLAISFFQENENELLSAVLKDNNRNIKQIKEFNTNLINELQSYYEIFEGKKKEEMIVNDNEMIEISMLNKKRRRELYEKESLPSDWINVTHDLYDQTYFSYYEGNSTEVVLIDKPPSKKRLGFDETLTKKNKCIEDQFCLYCNFIKLFDV